MDKIDLTRATQADAPTLEAIDELFQYQAWDPEQIEAGRRVRSALAGAYATVIQEVPPSPLRTRALNMIYDSRMLANAAITHKGRY